MSGTWVITSWAIPYQDKRYALFWLDEAIENRHFARNRKGDVRTFGSRISARATRSRLNRQSGKETALCNTKPLS